MENRKGKGYLEAIGIGGRMDGWNESSNRRCKGVDWIHLAQDRDQWRGLVNATMNFRFP